jgi:hypothetical protein
VLLAIQEPKGRKAYKVLQATQALLGLLVALAHKALLAIRVLRVSKALPGQQETKAYKVYKALPGQQGLTGSAYQLVVALVKFLLRLMLLTTIQLG